MPLKIIVQFRAADFAIRLAVAIIELQRAIKGAKSRRTLVKFCTYRTMNWLEITENSSPLYEASAIPSGGDAQSRSQRESFFNNVDDVHNTTPMRFCLPHQVRSCSVST